MQEQQRSAPGVGREQPDDSGSYPLIGATAATGVRDLRDWLHAAVCQSPAVIGTPTDRVPYRRLASLATAALQVGSGQIIHPWRGALLAREHVGVRRNARESRSCLTRC